MKVLVALFLVCYLFLVGEGAGSTCNLGELKFPPSAPRLEMNFCCWFRGDTCCGPGVETYDMAKQLEELGVRIGRGDCFLSWANRVCMQCSPAVSHFIQHKQHFTYTISICSDFCEDFYDSCRPNLSDLHKHGFLRILPQSAREFCEDVFTIHPTAYDPTDPTVDKSKLRNDTFLGIVPLVETSGPCYYGLTASEVLCSGCYGSLWHGVNTSECGKDYCEGSSCPIKTYKVHHGTHEGFIQPTNDTTFEVDDTPVKPSTKPQTNPSRKPSGGSGSSGSSTMKVILGVVLGSIGLVLLGTIVALGVLFVKRKIAERGRGAYSHATVLLEDPEDTHDTFH